MQATVIQVTGVELPDPAHHLSELSKHRAVANIGDTRKLEKLVEQREDVLSKLERNIEKWSKSKTKTRPTQTVEGEVRPCEKESLRVGI